MLPPIRLASVLLLIVIINPYVGSRCISEPTEKRPVLQKGMSYATYANMTSEAYSSPESNESLKRMHALGVEWVAVNVVWFQNNESSVEIRNSTASPSMQSVEKVIGEAHKLGMKVMLKPMIDLEKAVMKPGWRGHIKPSQAWFESYKAFASFWADFSEECGVDMLCIGCEYVKTAGHTQEWKSIIEIVRKKYSGPITYAASCSNYQSIDWWDEVDYVGINAYFNLTNKTDPTFTELLVAWKNWADQIGEFSVKLRKPVIFTEIGYLSCNGTNTQPWNYTRQWDKKWQVDLQEQADCYKAVLQTLWNRSWFYGLYWWYWQTDPEAGGPYNKDYTPQNKPAEQILKKWYELERTETPYGNLWFLSLQTLLVTILIISAFALGFILKKIMKPD